jgi:hypothetical protein
MDNMSNTLTLPGHEFTWRGKEGTTHLGDINSPSAFFLFLKKARCRDTMTDVVIGDEISIRSHKTGVCKLFECFDEGLYYDLVYKKYKSADHIYVTIWDNALYYEMEQ